MSSRPDGSSSGTSRSGSMPLPERSRSGSGIAVLAAILMAGNILSRLLGLVREQLAASLFGTGDAIAAFTVADNLQTLLFDLMVSGALQAALIPVLAQWAAPDLASRLELRRIGGTLIVLTTTVLGGLAMLGMIAAPSLVDGLIWFSGQPEARGEETRELTIRLVRIILPAAVLLGVGTLLQAILY
ncbi:MAG TPA: lipid II flippase MurJ, partial [Thermomicrobiales bacterium]|nr:lipid II flippase MurJ [Thermomicrobiales bacterium]